ncbi:transposase [Neobacillus mesonae]|uniref:transposase n=1 Tax=Neobacillus mesonae TaxID=1193713 RepID=UPI0008351676|nr:transposase [Neobacillus mesonae]
MPRRPRRKSCNGIYHIMLRGINRQVIFEDDVDKFRLLETIKRFKDISKIKIFSYCLMDNHVHLLVKETEEPVSRAIQRVSASYVFWYNAKYDRCGHLFQDRYKSESVETVRYFLTVLRYIHQNPVKAGLADNVFECKWTSIHEYIHQSDLVDIDFALNLFSPDRGKAIQLFSEFMQKSNDDHCLDNVEKIKMSDSEVISHLEKLGFPNTSALQQMEKEQRNQLILQLKGLNGVTIRQLSRITGISKSVIDRIH